MQQSTVIIKDDNYRASVYNKVINCISQWMADLGSDEFVLSDKEYKEIKDRIKCAQGFKCLFGHKGSMVTLTVSDAIVLNELIYT